MVRCSVLGCKSDGERKIAGLSFHSFPYKQNLREIWIAATGRNGWKPKKTSKICSNHFDTALLIKKLTKTYLDFHAVPTKLIKSTGSRTHEEFLPSTSAMEIDNSRDPDTTESILPNQTGLSIRVMAQNSRCRVCLAVDVRMHRITNTHHKEIFEKLSTTQLNAEDGRPNIICYICYSQLQRCCRFSDLCHKSEQLLREHLLHGTEVEGEEATELTHNLTVTALQSTSIDSSNQAYIEVEVNEELSIKEEEIEFKEEPIDIEESKIVDASVNDNPIGLEQPPVTVNVDTNNGCALPYCCDLCSETFLMKNELLIHLRIHVSKKRYACTRCNKKFTKISHLQSHMRIHTGEKPFACNMCNKNFTEKSSMRKHMKIHTGEKPFACNMCDKSFILNCDLQQHIRVHTGEKPYACNICDKAFNQNTNLHKHMRIHTGEKPYECNICNKTFTVMCNLKKHLRTHTGEKPFACTLCNKTFTERGSLRRHLIIHARDSP